MSTLFTTYSPILGGKVSTFKVDTYSPNMNGPLCEAQLLGKESSFLFVFKKVAVEIRISFCKLQPRQM